jgi:DNA polymerase III subunit delta'
MALAPIWDALDRSIPGQEKAVRALSAIVEHKSLAHAYLFSGPTGSGKLQAALTLAVAANCAGKGCGGCPLCLNFAALLSGEATHPDIHVMHSDGDQYSIESVREIRHLVGMTPAEYPTKFVIITEAERMREAQANTLLKTLEEPAQNTCIVLLTVRFDALLPTVRSRCQLVEFRPVPETTLVAALVAESGTDPVSARVAYQASRGRLDVARILLEAPAFARARTLVATIVDDLDRRDPAELLQDAGRMEALIEDLGEAAVSGVDDEPFEMDQIKDMAISKSHSGRLRSAHDDWAKRKTQNRKAEGTAVLLDLFALAYRDLLCAFAGADSLVVDHAALGGRTRFLRHESSGAAAGALEAVTTARRRIRRNVVPKNALAAMLLETQEVTRWRRRSA